VPRVKLFRKSYGRKGVSRFALLERAKDGPLYIESYNKRGEQQPRRALHKWLEIRTPIYKADADRIAVKLTEGLELKGRTTNLRLLLGLKENVTFGELLDRYHEMNEPGWSETSIPTYRSQKRWWLQQIHPDTSIFDLCTMVPEIERMVEVAADEDEWSPRTQEKYLKYLQTAVEWGRKKKKYITEEQNLSALDIPSPDSQGVAYELAEVFDLLNVAHRVDLRCAVACHIAFKGLRRIRAIRLLTVADVQRGDDGVMLDFGRKTDKAGKQGSAALVDQAALTVLDLLLQSPAVQASGLLFPDGDLRDPNPQRAPIRYEMMREKLEEAERLAGVTHVRGRLYHGFKRAGATLADDLGELTAASQQGGTLEGTLKLVYVRRNVGRIESDKKRIAGKMAAALKAAGKGRKPPQKRAG